MGFKFLILFLQISALVLIVAAFNGRKIGILSTIYSILTDLVIYGYVLNLLLVTYLPILIILLVGVVGIDWIGEGVNGQVMFNNVMTLFLTIIHMSIPTLIMINLYHNKDKIGVQKKLNLSYVME